MKKVHPDRATYEDAVSRGRVRYTSVCSCSNGHIGERYTTTRQCVTCTIGRSMAAYKVRKDMVKAGRAAAAAAADAAP